jgi:uncharacterized membrane protein
MKHLRQLPLEMLGAGLALLAASIGFFVMGAFAISAHRYGDVFYEFLVALVALGYAVACLFSKPEEN